MSHQFHPTVLREYDIRGIIGETLGTADAYAIGRGFATLLREAGGSKVAVGYDGRVSSPELEEALIAGLNASGVDAVRVGMGPTPMLYYAEASMPDVQGGIRRVNLLGRTAPVRMDPGDQPPMRLGDGFTTSRAFHA